jgi:hypothetical protein
MVYSNSLRNWTNPARRNQVQQREGGIRLQRTAFHQWSVQEQQAEDCTCVCVPQQTCRNPAWSREESQTAEASIYSDGLAVEEGGTEAGRSCVCLELELQLTAVR